ncbi:MAG: hypothetical protein ACYC0Z_13210 [Acidobacteriaceae bacterium]
MKSLGQMIMQIEGLLGTDDISDWEDEFIASIVERTQSGKMTATLSPKQVEQVERIYNRNFA